MDKQTDIVENKINRNVLELVTKTILGIAGAFYGLGVIVVNINLSKYGVYSLSLFRISYILAGLWVVLFFLLSYLLFFVANITYKATHKLGNKKRIFMVIISMVTYFVVVNLLSNSFQINISEIGWRGLLPLATVSFLMLSLSTWGNRFKQYYREKKLVQSNVTLSSHIKVDSNLITNIIFTVSIFVGVLFGFSRDIYTHIPAEFGGGKTMQVIVVTKIEHLNLLKATGINFTNISVPSVYQESENICLSEQIGLLIGGEHEYTFLLSRAESSYAVSVRADLIESMIYNTRFFRTRNIDSVHTTLLPDSLKNK